MGPTAHRRRSRYSHLMRRSADYDGASATGAAGPASPTGGLQREIKMRAQVAYATAASNNQTAVACTSSFPSPARKPVSNNLNVLRNLACVASPPPLLPPSKAPLSLHSPYSACLSPFQPVHPIHHSSHSTLSSPTGANRDPSYLLKRWPLFTPSLLPSALIARAAGRFQMLSSESIHQAIFTGSTIPRLRGKRRQRESLPSLFSRPSNLCLFARLRNPGVRQCENGPW